MLIDVVLGLEDEEEDESGGHLPGFGDPVFEVVDRRRQDSDQRRVNQLTTTEGGAGETCRGVRVDDGLLFR